jgi:hypothetical protein
MRVLTAWIGHVIGRIIALLDSGDYLPTDRAVGVVTLDEIEIMRSDSQRQLGSGKKNPRSLLTVELEMCLKRR